MQIEGQAKRVCIYLDESDKWEHKALYAAILEMLKAENCAGATVTRGLAGFGAHSRIHTAGLVALSADLPLVVVWVDNPARVERVMPKLKAMVVEGLITVEDVEVVFYSHRKLRQLPASLPVQDIMSREVHAVEAGTPLIEAVEMLLGKVYRALPVIDADRRVIGIVTEADLLKKLDIAAAENDGGGVIKALQDLNLTVKGVMTANPVTITQDTPAPEAVKLMLERNIKRLPAINAAGKLVGIISRVDVLRAMSRPLVGEALRQNLPPGRHPRVSDVMMTNVPAVQADAPLSDVAASLTSNIQHRVVVVDEGRRVVGIITDGDLFDRALPVEGEGMIRALTRRLPLQTEKLRLDRRAAAEVMTAPVVAIAEDAPLQKALQLLLNKRIKRLPVVNSRGELVGLIGRGGILQAMIA